MIIPLIQFDQLEDRSAVALIGRARRWSLFGKLAIHAEYSDVEIIRRVIHSLGHIDIQLQLSNATPEQLLELLNDGASHVVVKPDGLAAALDLIPAERILVASRDSQSPAPGVKGIGTLLNLVQSPGDQPHQQVMKRIESAPDTGTIRVQLAQEQMDDVKLLDDNDVDCVVDHRIFERHPDVLSGTLDHLLDSDRPDGLYPTVIVDALGTALGLAYSNHQSLLEAIKTRQGVYWSRSRNSLWVKGASSGATQKLLGIALDCDRDCLRFTVEQLPPGFCHKGTYACFGERRSIQLVVNRLAERISGRDAGSFTRKLAGDRQMLETKLLEEAQELADASVPDQVQWEAADLLYFSLVRMIDSGVSLADVHSELIRRMNRIVRRKNKLDTDQKPS